MGDVRENVTFGLRVRRGEKRWRMRGSASGSANCCRWCNGTDWNRAFLRSFPEASAVASNNSDSPAATYDQPASPFVYSFVGAVDRLPGQWRDGRLQVAGIDLAAPGVAAGQGVVELQVRPEHLQLAQTREGWPATLLSGQRSGPRQRLRARLHAGETEVQTELPARAMPRCMPRVPR